MLEFLSPDSRFMQLLGRMWELMLLNFLTILCCIPIITAGAAMTAMHTILLKMVRGEESYIVRPYFKAFKDNFRQATPVWLFMLLLFFLFGGGIYISNVALEGYPAVLKIIQFVMLILLMFIYVYVFPCIARFDNTFVRTITSSFLLAIGYLPRTIAMILVNLAVMAAGWFIPQGFPLYLCFCFTLPGYISAMLYSPVFRKIEENNGVLTAEPGDDWKVEMEEGTDTAGNENTPSSDGSN